MRKPNSVPLNTSPLRNWAEVHTDATVVNSLTVTVFGNSVPNTAINAMASLGPLSAAALGVPPLATK
jgi:hypothetical protein